MVNVAPPSVQHAGLASNALLEIRLNVHSLYSLLKVKSDKRTPCNCPVEWPSIRAPFSACPCFMHSICHIHACNRVNAGAGWQAHGLMVVC